MSRKKKWELLPNSNTDIILRWFVLFTITISVTLEHICPISTKKNKEEHAGKTYKLIVLQQNVNEYMNSFSTVYHLSWVNQFGHGH